MHRPSLGENDAGGCMKTINTKELVSLVGIAIAAPLLALGFVVSARAAGLVENDFLLLALALCGAVVSGINGFGRRTIKAQAHSNSDREVPQSSVVLPSRAS